MPFMVRQRALGSARRLDSAWIPRVALAVLAATRDASRWLGGASVAFRAGELKLQTSEGVNNFRCLKGSVSPTHRDLIEDPCLRQPVHRLIRLHLASSNVDGDNRCTN